jgi:hypothetical protein
MKFVKSNSLDSQKLELYGGPVHFIFGIDRSSSMGGQKWLDLKKALSAALDTIIKMSYS